MVMAKNHKPKEKSQDITTIKIYQETKERLDKLKGYTRESYDDVLRKILFILNALRKDPEEARSILAKIESSIKIKDRYTDIYDKKEPEKKNGERK
jgi:hypothetical protein